MSPVGRLVDGYEVPLPDPRQAALEAAVSAERLLDALLSRPLLDPTVDAPAQAAQTGLLACTSVYVALVVPERVLPAGEALAYYTAAGREIVWAVVNNGAKITEAIEGFFALGWQHTDPTRPGHQPWVERRPEGYVPGCNCGTWSGRSSRSKSWADQRALEHACWPAIILKGEGR